MRKGWLNARKGPIRVLLPSLRLLPPRRAARLVAGLGRAEYLLNPSLRREYDDALRRGARHFGLDWDIRRVAGSLVGNELRWRVRDHLLDGRPDADVDRLLRVSGRESLDGALAEGRGAILLFNHFGAFLMPAHWLVRNGYPLRWLTERPRNVSRLLARDFQSDGPLGQRKLFMSRKADTAEGATTIRRALRVLRAGMVVQIAGDVRWVGPRTVPARFLGRTYSFSSIWATLAALSGSPVVPAYGLMEPDGTYRVEFSPAFRIPAAANPGGLGPWVQSYLDELERRVREHPDHGSDYFFWAASSDYLVEPA